MIMLSHTIQTSCGPQNHSSTDCHRNPLSNMTLILYTTFPVHDDYLVRLNLSSGKCHDHAQPPPRPSQYSDPNPATPKLIATP